MSPPVDMSPTTAPTLLTIPCELRNAIYHYIFTPNPTTKNAAVPPTPDPLAIRLGVLQPTEQRHNQTDQTTAPPNNLRILLTNRQLHAEAHQLALSLTPFSVHGSNAKPTNFTTLTAPLRASKVAALRHLTLTARISYLRALNEDWHGYPFGHAGLVLETLTLVPTKAECTHTSYREVADLSQVHTLAYILAETVKGGLRNVAVLRVENRGCFNEVVFRLVYRSLVYRLFRWAGRECGVRVLCNHDEEGEDAGWFWVGLGAVGGEGWREVGTEVDRFLGRDGEMPNPELVGF